VSLSSHKKLPQPQSHFPLVSVFCHNTKFTLDFPISLTNTSS
jgi:hypothetical protein